MRSWVSRTVYPQPPVCWHGPARAWRAFLHSHFDPCNIHDVAINHSEQRHFLPLPFLCFPRRGSDFLSCSGFSSIVLSPPLIFSVSTWKVLIHVLLSSCLNFCHSGLPPSTICHHRPFHSQKHSFKSKHDSIYPVLNPKWLYVAFSIAYKALDDQPHHPQWPWDISSERGSHTRPFSLSLQTSLVLCPQLSPSLQHLPHGFLSAFTAELGVLGTDKEPACVLPRA